MCALPQDRLPLQHASLELRGDREVVMAAVAEHGYALEFASEDLRGDREVVMAAVANDGDALRFAAECLRGDREVVMTAICQDGVAVLRATKEMRGDEEVMQAALEASPTELVGLRVSLLSGRSCNQVFWHNRHVRSMRFIFRRSAELLDLDPDVVDRSGSLMFGESEISQIHELTPGKVHELTLVLS